MAPTPTLIRSCKRHEYCDLDASRAARVRSTALAAHRPFPGTWSSILATSQAAPRTHDRSWNLTAAIYLIPLLLIIYSSIRQRILGRVREGCSCQLRRYDGQDSAAAVLLFFRL